MSDHEARARHIVISEGTRDFYALISAIAAALEDAVKEERERAKVEKDLGPFTDEQWADIKRRSDVVKKVSECEHEWVDARNSAVLSGEYCPKCHAVRAGNK
jgi:hypothetical protein